ncbi:MAG: hypothetical protein EOO38_01270 [Cytophagaceae bacterium]|nr:MAG: hypothetical protein EOO38_01270 [Cytophagaceae bacterium]
MTDDTKVVIRDGQWLGSGDLFADYGAEEVIVALDPDAADHKLIKALPDNEHGQSVQSSREAMHRASEAASRAKARGNVDSDGRILVAVEDLTSAEE